jgi:hypothetical protein
MAVLAVLLAACCPCSGSDFPVLFGALLLRTLPNWVERRAVIKSGKVWLVVVRPSERLSADFAVAAHCFCSVAAHRGLMLLGVQDGF